MLWDEVCTGDPGVQDFCLPAQTSHSELVSPGGHRGSRRWPGRVENGIQSRTGDVGSVGRGDTEVVLEVDGISTDAFEMFNHKDVILRRVASFPT